jgi:chitin synthase
MLSAAPSDDDGVAQLQPAHDDDDDDVPHDDATGRVRYTSVTCTNPSTFSQAYKLRVMDAAPADSRGVETLIVITLYNEKLADLNETLDGICDNIAADCLKNDDPEAWRRWAVCIIADGRLKLHTSIAEQMELCDLSDAALALGMAQPDAAPIRLHLYESTQSRVREYTEPTEKTVRFNLQVVMAIKEENAGKLDSHRWFFNAFAGSIRPEYCVMLDVGTKPGPRSLMKLRNTLKTDPKVAGCCGQLEIDESKVDRTNLLHAAQQFEYQLANLMDKSMESTFGFISVLPGAFSAYRYSALRVRCVRHQAEDGSGDDALQVYFSSISKPLGPRNNSKALGPLKGNMFLAEDRVLVFELLATGGREFFLRYVSSAAAYTDPVNSLEGLLKQR